MQGGSEMGIIVRPSSPEFCVVSLSVILFRKGFCTFISISTTKQCTMSDDQKLNILVSFTTSPPPSLDLDRGWFGSKSLAVVTLTWIYFALGASSATNWASVYQGCPLPVQWPPSHTLALPLTYCPPLVLDNDHGFLEDDCWGCCKSNFNILQFVVTFKISTTSSCRTRKTCWCGG